jgi:ParB family chromosome partitioning protein
MPTIVSLPASVLTPHPQNPRPRLAEAEVAELRASIEAHGQVQPCVVRPVGENGSKTYQVVIGHRRAFVGKLLGRDVPCLVEDLDDDEALALMLSDITPRPGLCRVGVAGPGSEGAVDSA